VEAARPAVAEDAPAVLALVRAMVEELRPHRGGGIWSRREAHPEPLDGLIAERIADRSGVHHVVVGTVDDTVVGIVLAHVETLHDGDALMVIDNIFVDDGAREVGVGEAMLVEVEEAARRAGAVGLDAIVLPGDRHAKNFFETFGLTARAILVHRSLGPEAS
jgi:GNAT superfamily N-acetyltransferase